MNCQNLISVVRGTHLSPIGMSCMLGALIATPAGAAPTSNVSDTPGEHQPESDTNGIESPPADSSADQTGENDLFDLDLDDLLNMKLTATNPMSINHTHKKGELMLSYSYMHMDMDGNRNGTSGVSATDVLGSYMVAPLRMTMDMQMAMVMYAPTDKLTLMLMVPEVNKSMDLVTGMGVKFKTKSSGLGDVKLTGIFGLYEGEMNQFHFSVGMSFPTGSIDEMDTTPMGYVVLPYPMQLGSGTYDLITGLTYIGQTENWTWGAHLGGLNRLGENDRNYTLGDEYSGTAFVTYQISEKFNLTLKTTGKTWDNIDGADPALNPMMVPTADPNLRGGTRFDVTAGINYFQDKGFFEGNRLSLEFGVPYYQDLDGPQLETDWIASFQWSWLF